MKKAGTIMIQGTGSGVGKSLLVSALCRIFLRDGYRVAPYKAQNMALNSYVTSEGGEIGRAQATQAEASGIIPTVDMNPVLIKPSTDIQAQIIVKGKPEGNKSATGYSTYKTRLFSVVKESLDNLRKQYEIVVMEGAGSPAEVNLRKNDIVNMSIARASRSPVILVGDIDRGGVLAWIVGTLNLLTKAERNLVKGIIINKFRGDIRLFHDGIKFLEKKTGLPVLGVLPYIRELRIAEEDAVPFSRKIEKKIPGAIKIAVICLPHLSNFTDFDALEYEPDVDLKYIRRSEELDSPDIIIIPGTKNTIYDLLWLKNTGMGEIILSHAVNLKTMIIGICGGFQMLGAEIQDKNHIESRKKSVPGLGLLPIKTEMKKQKKLRQVEAKEIASGIKIKGYEIHHGCTTCTKNIKPLFQIAGKKNSYDGASSRDKQVWGTYIHGIFDNDEFRRKFLNHEKAKKGLELLPVKTFNTGIEFDKLAKIVKKNLDMKAIYNIVFNSDF